MKKYSSLLSIFIICLAAFWGFYDLKPSYVPSADSKTDFSIENALRHLEVISNKVHHVGTEEHKNVQNYIVDELKKLGLNPTIQTQSVVNKKWFAGTTSENIIARIEGSENGKALMLLSHYDSNPHSSLGASDAGSGVVTILEGIRAFLAENKTPKNDIIILISDAEELGLLGAKAFVEFHPWASDVGLVLNFEARGSGGSSYMLMETNGKNSKLVTEYLKANPSYPAGNSLLYSIYKKLPNDTDLTVFREIGDINGFNFAFIGDHFDYHTVQDSYDRLDRTTLAHQADYMMTMLHHFSNISLDNLNNDRDLVYVNFPILKILTYPFSWITTLLIITIVVLSLLVFFGIAANKINFKTALIGFIPALFAILICAGVSFLLWKGILMLHPAYNDMLQGFTYNGYWYISAFVALNIWISFFIYSKFAKKENITSLSVAPIVIWLFINILIPDDFKGAGFFIIPVIIAEIVLLISILWKPSRKNFAVLFAILSIPTVYIFAPLIQLFPVGLGLKMLFISGVFVALLFSLLIPALIASKSRKPFTKLFGILSILLFVVATFKSGFSIENKRPNSLVYTQNLTDSTAYWGTYNKTLDAYISQKMGDNPVKGGINSAQTKSKYNTRFSFHQKAKYVPIATSEINLKLDTIIGNDRLIEFSVTPKRKIHKYELIVSDTLKFKKLFANEIVANEGKSFTISKGSFLIYHMANSDKNLEISITIDKAEKPTFLVNEISYDLLSYKAFNIKPRTVEMMAMPFVTNDAIISTQQIKF